MHQHRILLIEDEPELSELLAELLGDFSYEVRRAGTMAEADAILADYRPCAVITDLTLPDVSKDEVVGRIRPKVGEAPILLMSAIGARDLARMAEEQGAQGIIPKPFDLEEFEKAVVFQCPEATDHASA